MKQKNKVSHRKVKKIERAEIEYRKIWEEIKPFIKKRETKRYSTVGQWKISSFDF